MADKPAVLGGTAIKPVERHGWEAVKYFIHNPDTGEYFTRTPKSWALIIIFYVIYYTFLAGFWAAMLMVFFTTINDRSPKWIGDNGLIGISPGLGLKPVQTDEFIDSSMILFNVDTEADRKDVAGWGGWASRSQLFLDKYNNPTGDSVACSPGQEGIQANQYCRFELDTLGPCQDPRSAFKAGKPCIYLKLNRIYGVRNQAYNSSDSFPEDMPEPLKTHVSGQADKNQVWINCRGENPADIESIGQLKYYPESRGIPDYFFPYRNQPGYQSPIVAVQFDSVARNQLVHVECRAWAKNIGYNRRDRIGINHLELLLLTDEAAQAVNEDS